jgi:FKBP-type peptidyl-prolyl cis-trans isomerase (trigger factor)
MKINHYGLECSFKKITPHFYQAHIKIPKEFVDAIFNEAATAQKKQIQTRGFGKGKTPLAYITENYVSNLTEHVNKYLFTYFVLPFLYDNIYEEKLLVGGEPRIQSCTIKPNEDALFVFDISVILPIELKNWKNFNFKAPKRKNYKDIDRQVDDFIKEETTIKENHQNHGIAINDWVNFAISLVHEDHRAIFKNHQLSLWLKIGNEAADNALQDFFLKKKVNDEFYSNEQCLQECFSNHIPTASHYYIKIQEIVPHAFFCLDAFKRHFKIQTKKDMQKKLIEVFSYRNDLTQRHAMIEEVFKMLLSKHLFEPPHYTVLRQQQLIVDALHDNPDYHVYRTEENFHNNIEKLAKKQVKEMMLIDQIAHEENIQAGHNDIRDYLNFTKRARMKEFLYFTPPETKVNGQEFPVAESLLTRSCLREKTLNHILYHLTKK